MTQPKQSSLLQVLNRVAPKIGAIIETDPEWHVIGQITFKNGRKRYFRNTSFDINRQAAAEIAKDKDFSNYFLAKFGYPVVPGSQTFFSPEWSNSIGVANRGIDQAYQHALKIGFPVIVKPNSGSMGMDVTLTQNKEQFYQAVNKVFERDRVVLVQQPVVGNDYRVVVLNGRVISAYQRIALHVVGDGQHTIGQLLSLKKDELQAQGRSIHINSSDFRITTKLSSVGLDSQSIPEKGQAVYLLDNANLSSGGSAKDVTHSIHPDFAQQAVSIARDMGLILCGVDI